MEPTGPDLLRALVALGRAWHSTAAIAGGKSADPQPGDLVVEVTAFSADPDAIGWLVGHDLAPYGADDPLDGSVPMREVWDIRPLNPDAGLQDIGGEMVQRWENATFIALPERVAALIPSDDLAAMTRRTTDMLTRGEEKR